MFLFDSPKIDHIGKLAQGKQGDIAEPDRLNRVVQGLVICAATRFAQAGLL